MREGFSDAIKRRRRANSVIPAFIRRLTETPIEGKGDWIRRSRRARDLLIERHGYHDNDFYVVGKDASPCLGMVPLYPAHWGHARGKWPRRKRGRGLPFPFMQRFPVGLVLHNPGRDYWGEAGDDSDPLMVLGHVEMWAAVTYDEWLRMLEEDAA